MSKNSNALFRIDSVDLQMDMVLFDYIYPVLFTCIGDNGKFYIVVCYDADAKTKEWLIAETTNARVISLLQNRTTIRDMFLNTPLWQAILKRGEDFPTVARVNADDIDQHCLPTAGEYMDADPGEFDEEIQALASREESTLCVIIDYFSRKSTYQFVPKTNVTHVLIRKDKYSELPGGDQKCFTTSKLIFAT